MYLHGWQCSEIKLYVPHRRLTHHFLRPVNAELVSGEPFPYPGVDRPLRGNCHPLFCAPDNQVRCVFGSAPYQNPPSTVRNMRAVLKRLPGVRDAFSEAFGVKNRLLRYGRDIRYRKRPPTVRDASSKARRTADSTDCGQPTAAPDASSVRETAPALFVRSGGPFPCSFDGTRCQKRPPLGGEQT